MQGTPPCIVETPQFADLLGVTLNSAPLIPDNGGAERSSVPDPVLPQRQPILGIATSDKGHAPWGIGCSSSLITFWDLGALTTEHWHCVSERAHAIF